MTMYSTKYWDITTSTGERYNFTSPGTQTMDGPDCVPNEGYGGFDIDVIALLPPRGRRRAASDRRTCTPPTSPWDTVICTNPDAVDE